MPGSLRVGRFAGIDIFIHVSWLIVLALLTVSLASSWFPSAYPGATYGIYLLLGLLAAVLLFVSVLLHELAHSLVAQAYGLPVKNITLFIFGGISNIEQEPKHAGVEFQVAIVGPLTSLVIGGLAWVLLFAVPPGALAATLAYLATANVLLAIFNLIPGFPLDGGRVLRSIVWQITGNAQKATQVATFIGQLVAYIFILGGIWLFFATQSFFTGIWLGFIGWFLLNAAQAARQQAALELTLGNLRVAQMMKAPSLQVPATISLQQLVESYFLPQGQRCALVVEGEHLLGLISLSDVRRVRPEQWATTSVDAVMRPVENLHSVSPLHSLRDALRLMITQDINQLPVLQDGRLVGVLDREAVIRSLQIRQSLGLDQACIPSHAA